MESHTDTRTRAHTDRRTRAHTDTRTRAHTTVLALTHVQYVLRFIRQSCKILKSIVLYSIAVTFLFTLQILPIKSN